MDNKHKVVDTKFLIVIEDDIQSILHPPAKSMRKKSLLIYYSNPVKCKNCDKIIMVKKNERVCMVRKKKFCNSSCSASFSNHQRKVKRYCLNCNRELGEKAKKYCSYDCQSSWKYKSYIDRWKLGLEDGMRGDYSISINIRNYLKRKYNNTCQECGWGRVNPFSGKVPLEIEHIDGDYRNNKEENLKLLCPNCHSLTPTYRGLNKGNGRQDRRKYDLVKQV